MMKPGKLRLRLLALFTGLVMLAALGVQAHSPFGSSTLVTVGDELKIELTMGMEGSVNLLATAGESKEVVVAAHHPKATNFFCELPAEFAARLFVLKSDSANLTARNVQLSSDGVDDVYALTYPRPAPGLLEIEASYFKHIETLAQGVRCAEHQR